MRSGGRRGNFRGTVESPFLRHRFTDARQDNLLPSLREAAAALCRNADRETLIEVVKLLEGADPRNRLARRAARLVCEQIDSCCAAYVPLCASALPQELNICERS